MKQIEKYLNKEALKEMQFEEFEPATKVLCKKFGVDINKLYKCYGCNKREVKPIEKHSVDTVIGTDSKGKRNVSTEINDKKPNIRKRTIGNGRKDKTNK